MLHTKRGTRPGSPIADVIFHVVMVEIVHQVDQWVLDQPLLQDAFGCLGLDMRSIVWSDDLAIPLATKAASDLVPLVRKLMVFLYDLFGSYGFALNMDAGKTSAVLTFRGPQAPELRKSFQLQTDTTIECPRDGGEVRHMLFKRKTYNK